jgi:hypothetical protein
MLNYEAERSVSGHDHTASPSESQERGDFIIRASRIPEMYKFAFKFHAF